MASIDPDKKKALGRGLASLIPEVSSTTTTTSTGTPILGGKKEYFLCDIEKIVPNTYQPRKIFNKEALEELVESIKVHGILQPLVVRQKDGQYELIAGERRWRAAQRAGLKQIPILVKEVATDGHSLEMAIIENIQREALNCIEEAIAYQQLIEEFNLSQEEVAQRVGKSRVTVTNTIRLLKLPAVIREDITSGKISMGHARTILGLESAEDQLLLRELIIKKKLSVRDTERKVQEILKSKSQGKEPSFASRDANIQALEDSLRRRFQTPVKLVGTDHKGFVQIAYNTREDLMRITDILIGFDTHNLTREKHSEIETHAVPQDQSPGPVTS